MRSPLVTFLLAICALILCGLVGWRLSQGSLDALFGAPPAKIGDALYPNFKAGDVKKIVLVSNGVSAVFVFNEKTGWQAEAPWKDRMDPWFASSIIDFTLGTHVADVIPKEKLDPKQAGFSPISQVQVRLEGADGRPLSKYTLGKRTSWIGQDPNTKDEVPTVFIRPMDKSRKSYVYACTGDIHPIFKDGFRYLRDHQPFLFRPQYVQNIRIRNAGGELTLGRESPLKPWRILKPLNLPTDPAAMKRLLEGLTRLRAVKVSDRASITLPTNGAVSGSEQIALKLFGSDEETVLDILPLQSPDARTRLATISDRKNAVFELPAKSQNDLVSLAELPVQVNELRDSTLTNLNIASLKAILIHPDSGSEIILTREPKQWIMHTEEAQQPANDHRLYDLLKAVTEAKVAGFVTDAATDFSPWGLDHPFLTLRFLATDNQALELAFGHDKTGVTYVNRRGTSTVMRVDDEIMSRLSTKAYQWRGAQLWSLNRVDIEKIAIRYPDRPPIVLNYNFNLDSWIAFREEKDVSLELEPTRANYLLESLEKMTVSRWLPAADPSALKALEKAPLVFTILSNHTDSEGEDVGKDSVELRIAPASQGTGNRFYYGQLSTEKNPFILDFATIQKLTVGLFGEDR